MDIIGTGLSGLVGSRIVKLLTPTYLFEDLSKETGVEILDFSTVREKISASSAPWVFHFAAYTDVQGAENEKHLGDQSISWRVNVEATKNIVQICKDTGKRLLYLSTDYVFDGKKEFYCEMDAPNPISWYGRTKFEGEQAVQALGAEGLILRLANPYRSHPVGKTDFVHKILERFIQKQEVQAPKDQIFSPTFIDDLAFCIDAFVRMNAEGIYHVGSDLGITPFDAANIIKEAFDIQDSTIVPCIYEAYFAQKAKPPKQAFLKHDKIDALGIALHSFKDGIYEVVKQERNL